MTQVRSVRHPDGRKKFERWIISLIGYTVVDLFAIHPKRSVIVEYESMEPKDCTCGNRGRVEQLCFVIRIDDDGCWVVEKSFLSALYGEIGEQVVWCE